MAYVEVYGEMCGSLGSINATVFKLFIYLLLQTATSPQGVDVIEITHVRCEVTLFVMMRLSLFVKEHDVLTSGNRIYSRSTLQVR
jgi:hypothetical protein